MLERRAIVIYLDGDEAVVAAQHGGCGHCDSVQGCGSGKLAKLFCSQPRQFRVRNDVNARVGEEIQISVVEGALLRSASILYLLPLALLLVGGVLGSHWAVDVASRDGYSAAGAVIGLVAGFVLARLLASRQHVLAVAGKSIDNSTEDVNHHSRPA